MHRLVAVTVTIVAWLAAGAGAGGAETIKILFLGDNGHHTPRARFAQLAPVLSKRGIELTYTDKMESLAADALAGYDGLAIYANTTRISPEQERALIAFVEGGKGLIALHCASYCFLNSDKYVALVGAQFQKHGTGTFRTTVVPGVHPITQGFDGFESWDETYVHTRHNEAGRTVLEYRAEGGAREPWTWVRTQGAGRVFYTAWGHDQRTWSNPGFQNLVERGIRWATGRDPAAAATPAESGAIFQPAMNPARTDVAPFEYVDVGKKIPNYTRGARWGAQDEPLSQMQQPLPPEESLKHLVVPRGFHVELFASEPELGGKPIAMNWDERGRLWVAETYDYPNQLQSEGEGRDRIRICEDTDGDGRADRFTMFAEKLSIPTSLSFARGGLIVFDGRQTIFLRDTDGDDMADERRVLFGTWAQNDTHGGPSNMQYGLDNWIWAMQGYNNSKLTVGGVTHQFRQGFLRFKSDGSQLEFIRSTNNNTWGLGISEEGLVLGSTANRNPSVYMPIANRYYERVRGWKLSLVLDSIADTHLFHPITDKVRQVDHFGGYTAAAGHSLYTARRYPREFWNRTAFVCEPTGHLVGTFVLERNGADFRSSNPFNLLASDDEWTAPTMAEVGPDSNVWVIDWYNFIVQHNPTPIGFTTGKGAAYESELRDKKHGRIYRVVYDGDGQATTEESFSLKDATPDKLVETLANSNLFWRRHAQRLLVERGQLDVVPQLTQLAADTAVDELGLNVGAIHALWTLDGLGALEDSLTVGALKHPSAGLRRTGLQLLKPGADSVSAILSAKLLDDPDAQVRLAALLALADLPAAAAVPGAVLPVLQQPIGRWLGEAAICAAANNADRFLTSLSTVSQPSERTLEAARVVAEHFARGEPGSVDPLVATLLTADIKLAEAVVQGLAKGWPKDRKPVITSGTEANLERLVERLSSERRGALVQLAIRWGSQKFERHAAELASVLLAKVGDNDLSAQKRAEAARELVALESSKPQTVGSLLEQVTPRTETALAVELLLSVNLSESDEAGALVAEKLATLTPAVRAAAVGVLLARPAWTVALLDCFEAGEILPADLSLEQQRLLAEHPDQSLRRRAGGLLRRRGSLPNVDRRKVLDELADVTRETGDAAAGKQAFTKHCAKCHVRGGEGQRVGPDLTGMATHTKEELLSNIIDPSRSVEGNFRVYTITTTAGQVLSGLLAGESRTALELFDSEGRKTTILRDDVDQLVASNRSLMPDGFEKQASRQELVDLLEFLTTRGRYLPLPLDKAATAVSTRGMFYSRDAAAERLIFSDWKPKEFAGVPFQLIDPETDRVANVVVLYGPQGAVSATMPKRVSVPCRAPAKAIHLLSGASGWGHPLGTRGSVSLIVRLHYDDGTSEDHELKNGEHFADYIRRVDVPASQFAFNLAGRQIRYLPIQPKRTTTIDRIELVKGPDDTAPVVMAMTVELP